MFLSDDLQGECDAEGEDTRIYQRNPAGNDVAEIWFFRYQHNDSGENTAKQALDTVQPQAIHLAAQMVHQCDLNSIAQSAAQEIKITDINLRYAHTAQQIQSDYGKGNADPCGKGWLLAKEDTEDRNQNDIHGCYEACFSGGCMDNAQLLQAGCNKERDAAGKTGFPEIWIQPLLKGVCGAAFNQKNNNDQKGNRQNRTHGLKCKGADIVHAHTLSDKSRAPDYGCDQQREGSAKFVFHINHHGRL